MDELNLSKWPLVRLGGEASSPSLYFEEMVRLDDGSSIITRSLRVSSPEGVGLPEITDEEVLLGLMAITTPDSPVVSFTPGRMKDLLGWPRQGYYDQILNRAIHRWHSVKLEFHGAWFDKMTGKYLDTFFNVLTTITEVRTKRGISSYEVTWHEIVFESLRRGHTFSFDWSKYKLLKSAIAQRMFRVFSRQSHIGAFSQTYELRDLAFNKIGISKGGNTPLDNAQIKQRISRGFLQLEEVGFLVPSPNRYSRRADGSLMVDLQVQVQVRDQPPSPAKLDEKTVQSLTDLGMRATIARSLVSKHGSDYVTEKIEVMRKSKKVKTKAGFIVDACKHNYSNSQIDEGPKKVKVIHAMKTETEKPAPTDPWSLLNADEKKHFVEWALREHANIFELEIPQTIKKWPKVVQGVIESITAELWKKHILKID